MASYPYGHLAEAAGNLAAHLHYEKSAHLSRQADDLKADLLAGDNERSADDDLLWELDDLVSAVRRKHANGTARSMAESLHDARDLLIP